MKKIVILFVACLVIMALPLMAGGKEKKKDCDNNVVLGEFQSGDFTTSYWMEAFKGNPVGAPGSVLSAAGQGFHFDGATSTGAQASDNPSFPGYKTIYTGGMLLLDGGGPWLDVGVLRATNVTATNYSVPQIHPLVDPLNFTLFMCGKFDKQHASDQSIFFSVIAHYVGTPDVKFDKSGKPLYQKDDGFDVQIKLSESDACPVQ